MLIKEIKATIAMIPTTTSEVELNEKEFNKEAEDPVKLYKKSTGLRYCYKIGYNNTHCGAEWKSRRGKALNNLQKLAGSPRDVEGGKDYQDQFKLYIGEEIVKKENENKNYIHNNNYIKCDYIECNNNNKNERSWILNYKEIQKENTDNAITYKAKNAYKTSDNCEKIKFIHSTLGSPAYSTFIKAIKYGWINIPGNNEKMAINNNPNSQAETLDVKRSRKLHRNNKKKLIGNM
jgi:hypothetical protein